VTGASTTRSTDRAGACSCAPIHLIVSSRLRQAAILYEAPARSTDRQRHDVTRPPQDLAEPAPTTIADQQPLEASATVDARKNIIVLPRVRALIHIAIRERHGQRGVLDLLF